MIYFVINVISVVLYSILSTTKTKIYRSNKEAIYFPFIFACIFLVSALRAPTVGIDTYNYIMHFKNVSTMDLTELFYIYGDEPGFYLLCKIISLFTYDYQWMLAIVAAIYAFSVCNFIKNYSKDSAMSVFMLLSFQFFAFSITGLRQTIAISIFMFSIKYVLNRNFLKYFLLIILGTLFHKSIVFALPVYFFTYINITANKRYFFIVMLPIIYLLREKILSYGLEYFYSDYSIYSESVGSIATFLLYFGIWIIYLLFTKHKDYARNDLFEKMLMIGIMLQLFVPIQPNIFRLCSYYQISSLIMLPEIIKVQKLYRQRLIMAVSCYIILTIMYFGFTYNAAGLNPYFFFWEI